MTEYIKQQIDRLEKRAQRFLDKAAELKDYLNGNPRNGFIVSYCDPTELEGGFEFGNAFDIIYVGSIVMTKYGDVAKVKAFENDEVVFEDEDDLEPVGSSRISAVNISEESLLFNRTCRREFEEKGKRMIASGVTNLRL